MNPHKISVEQYVESIRNLYTELLKRDLGDVIAEYENKEPNWVRLTILRLTEKMLNRIRQCINDPNNSEVTFDKAKITGHYPVEWSKKENLQWDESLGEAPQNFVGIRLGTGTDEDFEGRDNKSFRNLSIEKRTELFENRQEQFVLQLLTSNTAVLKRNDNYYPAVSPYLTEILDNLPIEQQNAILNKLYSPCVIRHGFNGNVESIPFAGYINIEFNPFVIDEDNDRAYYPIVCELIFAAFQTKEGFIYKPNPSTWTPEQQRAFWDSLFKTITASRDQLTTWRPKAETWHGIPINPATAAILAAIWNGGEKAQDLSEGWQSDEDGNPIYKHRSIKDDSYITVYPKLSKTEINNRSNPQDLWDFVKQLSPFTGDVLLSVLAEIGDPAKGEKPRYPLLEPVKITVDDILAYKSIKRSGKEQEKNRENVLKEMDVLGTLYFDVYKWPVPDPATGQLSDDGITLKGCRLFHINVQGNGDWLVQAGEWAYWWLNSQGWASVARMARLLLEVDHRGTALTKKIGQFIVLLNEALKLEEPVDFQIAALLDAVGELPIPEERGKNWANRTRERLDDALRILQESGVFTNVEWSEGYGPNDPDRSKGWVTRWLAAKIYITLPGTPPASKSKSIALNIPPDQKNYGMQIRRKRGIRRVSQEELARQFNITNTYLSLIENGKAIPSDNLKKAIDSWLQDDYKDMNHVP